MSLKVESIWRQLAIKRDLLKEAEYVVGDGGVEEEEENDDGGDGSTVCFESIVSVQ